MSVYSKQKRFKNKKRLAIISVACALVIAGLVYLGVGWNNKSNNNTNTDQTQTKQQAQTEVEQTKEEAANQSTAPTTTPSTDPKKDDNTSTPKPTSLKPVITFAGYKDSTKKEIEISSFVPNVYENGGTCTITATYSGTSLTETSTGYKNSNYTSCTKVFIATDRFGGATKISVTVNYKSSSGEGTSDAWVIGG